LLAAGTYGYDGDGKGDDAEPCSEAESLQSYDALCDALLASSARAVDRDAAGSAEVVLLLLRYGADPRERDHRQQTPLHVAAKFGHGGAARALLADARCDPALLDVDGKAAAQWATQLGHSELVRLIPTVGPPMTTIKLLRRQMLAERKAEAVGDGTGKRRTGTRTGAKTGGAAVPQSTRLTKPV
jgi:hypothetical protein